MPRKKREKKTPIEKQRLTVKTITTTAWIFFPVILFISIAIGPIWLIAISLILGGLAFCSSGVKIVQSPERWIVERFGKFKRNLEPGWRWTIPWIDTIRKKPRVMRHAISMFLPEKEGESAIADFVDGSVPMLNPILYAIPDKDHPEYLIYEVDDWADWIRDNLEPVLLGYLRTLKIREALDEGMARGNLLDRIRETRGVVTRKLRVARRKTKELKEMAKTNSKKKDVLAPLIDEFQEAADRLSGLVSVYESTNQELDEVLEEAKAIGVAKIPGAFIGDFILPPEIDKARQAPLIAQREAEAAFWQAVKEATLRAEPVFQTAAKLIEAGLTKREAITQALGLERLETLTEKKMWTAGLAEVFGPFLEKLAPSIVETFLSKLGHS